MEVATAEDAQRSFDRFCELIGDARARHDVNGHPSTVGALADAERLLPLPASRYPETMEPERE